VHWYQKLFLKAIDPGFALEKIDFAKTTLPKGAEYPEVAEQVLERLNAWSDPDVKPRMQAIIERLSKSYGDELAKINAGSVNPEDKKIQIQKLDQKHNYRLCYNLVREFGPGTARALVAPQE
jgi:hypothetical protein